MPMAEDPRYDKITILMFVFVLLAPLSYTNYPLKLSGFNP